jgi:LCP family protein required for cell wall assembly
VRIRGSAAPRCRRPARADSIAPPDDAENTEDQAVNDYREPPRGGRPADRPDDHFHRRPGRADPRFGYHSGDDDTRIIRPIAPPRGDARSGPWARAGEPGWADPQPGQYGGEPRGYPGQRGLPPRETYQPAAPYGHDAVPPYGRPGYGGGLPPAPPPHGPRHGGGPDDPDGQGRSSGRVVLGRIVAALVSLALLVSSGLAWAAVGGTPHNASNATDQAGSVGVVTQTTDAHGNVIAVPATAGLNILIVGSDARTDAEGNPLTPEELKAVSTQLDGGGVSTDTLMIVHVPSNGAKATAISIPRDTWIGDDVVQAAGVVGPYSDGTEGPYKANKVNSFYGSAMTYEREYLVSQGVSDQAELQRRSAEAGRIMLIKVLQQFTGIKIDHYAEVNLIGFYLLSDAIGGVPVCLLKPVKDRQSGADFPAGHFEVSGSDALSFVRQRHGLPAEDLDRVRRQQAFLASAADKILSVGTLTSPGKLSKLIDAANRSLVLDKGFDLLSFAQQMMNLTSGNITFTTIPTHGSTLINGKSALKSDTAEVQGFFANLMTDRVASSSSAPAKTSVNRSAVIVDVQNGTETPGMAAQAGTVVAAAGFQRGQLSDYPGVTPDNQQAKTTIHYPAGGEAAAALVAKTLKVGTAVADDAVSAGHVLVVVGTDMPVIPKEQLPSVTSSAPTTTPGTSALSTTLPSDAITGANVACVN